MPEHALTWMIWYEPDPAVIPPAALQAGMAHFARKYGQVPNRAQVPLDWPESLPPDGLSVERVRYVLPRHLHLAYEPQELKFNQEPTLP